MKVTVLYDFTSEIENELSIIGKLNVSLDLIKVTQSRPLFALCLLLAGEVLTVTDADIGNGWWEGVNSKGRRGIFPASCKATLMIFFVLYI